MFIGSSPSATFRLATRSTSSLAPVSRWKIKRSSAPRRTILPTTRAIVRMDFSRDCFVAHLAAAKLVKGPGPKRAEARESVRHPLVPARGTPRRERRGDPVARTQPSALDSRHKRVHARLRRAMRGNERRRCVDSNGICSKPGASEVARCPGMPLPLQCDCRATARSDFIAGWTSTTPNELAFPRQRVCCEEEGWGMSSYASYCQDQATDCARRARLARSPEIVAHCRRLEFRWARLVLEAQAPGGALAHGSDLAAATLVPLEGPIATGPVDYANRAGELIARGARSLRSTLRQKRSAPPREPNGP